ncbi:Putative methyltransferase family protein [Striga hermonthica]|uniref:Methyltransferase family protein n=1 Tax=Striga hermonthica TaxID=68872 RepID=A0A9N7RCS5_STRHE|nr:Putative methyltransferase family protein [Striga hermonthica]
MESQGEDEEIVCLDESFFISDNYQLTRFTFGSHVLELYCLQSASTDFDLTGQLVWPGAELLNDFLSKNADMLHGCSVIELGSGVGITGILCSRFCEKVVMTDHNDEVLKILKRNIELHDTSQNLVCSAELKAEKLEWGNSEQLDYILQSHPQGFDLSSIPWLFDSVKKLIQFSRGRSCRFILAYVSRAKIMDNMVLNEATRLGLRDTQIAAVAKTRIIIIEIYLSEGRLSALSIMALS